MITADFHTHCNYSGDSEEPLEAMIKGAISKSLDTLCVTDHMDLGFPYEPEDMFTFDAYKRQQEFKTVASRYASDIKLLHGIELGIMSGRTDLFEIMQALVTDIKFDFVIGSVHFIDGLDPYYEEFWSHNGSKENAVKRYFESILEGINEYKNFDVLGHIDYAIRYVPEMYGSKDYDINRYMTIIDEILHILVAEGKGLEINTKGFVSGLPFFHPKKEILLRYKEIGGEIVTIGSDAHNAAAIGGAFGNAASFLNECGFKYYSVFENREVTFRKI